MTPDMETIRHDCEVDYLAARNDAWVAKFLQGVAEKRGADAAMKLGVAVYHAKKKKRTKRD